jgi:hypothetical protein
MAGVDPGQRSHLLRREVMKSYKSAVSQFFDERRSRLSLIFLTVLVAVFVLIFIAVRSEVNAAARTQNAITGEWTAEVSTKAPDRYNSRSAGVPAKMDLT